MPVYLLSESLCSKWGFADGDLLSDFAYDAGIECDIRAALVALVRSHLLPLITCEFEVYEIETSHNPIRFKSWRGVEVDGYGSHRIDGFEAVEVEVSDADVRAALLAAVEIPKRDNLAIADALTGDDFAQLFQQAMARFAAGVGEAVGPLQAALGVIDEWLRQCREESWQARTRRGGALRDYRRKTRHRNRRRR